MKAMTVGFIFDHHLANVLLIKKNRPEWQKGYYNGVGGHLELKEMSEGDWAGSWCREVSEEVGLVLSRLRVIQIGRIVVNDIIVIVYAYKLSEDGSEGSVQKMTDEIPRWFDPKLIVLPIIENLSFFIPFARYVLKHQSNLYNSTRIELHYKK